MLLWGESSSSVQHCRIPRIFRTGTPTRTTGELVLLREEPEKKNKIMANMD